MRLPAAILTGLPITMPWCWGNGVYSSRHWAGEAGASHAAHAPLTDIALTFSLSSPSNLMCKLFWTLRGRTRSTQTPGPFC